MVLNDSVIIVFENEYIPHTLITKINQHLNNLCINIWEKMIFVVSCDWFLLNPLREIEFPDLFKAHDDKCKPNISTV